MEDRNIAYLNDVYVDPRRRKCGIGRTLVCAALSAFPEAVWIARVSTDNTSALSLLERTEFLPLGEERTVARTVREDGTFRKTDPLAAIDALRTFPPVHAPYVPDYLDELCTFPPRYSFYALGHCIVVEDSFAHFGDGRSSFYTIHATEKEIDIEEIFRKTFRYADNLRKKRGETDVSHILIRLVCAEELPERLRTYERRSKLLIYAGKTFLRGDSHVRELKPSRDSEDLSFLCGYRPQRGRVRDEADTWFGNFEAELLCRRAADFDSCGEAILGYREELWDGRKLLRGTLRYKIFREWNCGIILGMYVLPETRKQGFGKALVRSLIARNPDITWLCSIPANEEELLHYADSLGFRYVGDEVMLYDDHRCYSPVSVPYPADFAFLQTEDDFCDFDEFFDEDGRGTI